MKIKRDFKISKTELLLVVFFLVLSMVFTVACLDCGDPIPDLSRDQNENGETDIEFNTATESPVTTIAVTVMLLALVGAVVFGIVRTSSQKKQNLSRQQKKARHKELEKKRKKK